MKFTQAWVKVQHQNVTFRFVIFVLCLSIIGLSVTSLKLALRTPLIIERACHSHVVPIADSKHTESEIRHFLMASLAKRFNSDATDYSAYLSKVEEASRLSELSQLSSKNLTQKIVIYEIKLDGSKATVELDRVIRFGNIRSAISFPVLVELVSVPRTRSNPYGLIIQSIQALNNQEERKE